MEGKISGRGGLFNLSEQGVMRSTGWKLRLDKLSIEKVQIFHNEVN